MGTAHRTRLKRPAFPAALGLSKAGTSTVFRGVPCPSSFLLLSFLCWMLLGADPPLLDPPLYFWWSRLSSLPIPRCLLPRQACLSPASITSLVHNTCPPHDCLPLHVFPTISGFPPSRCLASCHVPARQQNPYRPQRIAARSCPLFGQGGDTIRKKRWTATTQRTCFPTIPMPPIKISFLQPASRRSGLRITRPMVVTTSPHLEQANGSVMSQYLPFFSHPILWCVSLGTGRDRGLAP